MKRASKNNQIIAKKSLLVITCGVVAALYVVYRITLVAYPVTVLGNAAFTSEQSKVAVCAQDSVVTPEEPAQIPSGTYKQRINEQPRLSENLVTNPTLADTNPETNQPNGYSHSTDSDDVSYQVLDDPVTSRMFLRVTDARAKNTDITTTPSWLMDPVSVATGSTYAYSLQYKNDVPIRISVEYFVAGSQTPRYSGAVTLQPSTTWKAFDSHFNATDGTVAFRVITSQVRPGITDISNLAVARIADAKLSSGLVSVTFDDGWQSVSIGAMKLLDTHAIKTTQYVISDIATGDVPGYMDVKTLRALKDKGHEIGSHSLRHCNQTTLSDAQLLENGLNSKRALQQQGLGPIVSFAYPLGQYTEKTQRILTRQYPYVRTSDSGYNDRYFDETNIRSMSVLSTTSDADLKGWLDYAAANHVWVVIVYHRIDESGDYNVTHETLERHLKLIKQSKLNVLPLSQAAGIARQ